MASVDVTETRVAKKRPGRSTNSERILDSAQELFAKHGPAAVTVRQVAEKAGVTHALVHKYFGSKDDLIKAVVDRVDVKRAATAKASASLRDVYQELLPRVMAPARPQHDARALGDGGHGVRVVGREDSDHVRDGRARTKTRGFRRPALAAASRHRPARSGLRHQRHDLGLGVDRGLGVAHRRDSIPPRRTRSIGSFKEIVGYLADLTLVARHHRPPSQVNPSDPRTPPG